MTGSDLSKGAGEDNDYFNTLFEWTRRKHDVLEKYAESFVRIKSNLYCVDAFAGRGQHRDGNRGSPLITASIAQRLHDEGKPYWLKCINIERNPEYYQTLVELTSPYSPELVRNIQGDFAGYLTYVMMMIGDSPALFFLDPFGVEGIEWDRIRPILSRGATTELLINFNVRYVPRLAGHLGSNAAAAAAKTRLLTDVLGTDQWKQFIESDKSLTDTGLGISSTSYIVELYKSQLRQHFQYVYHYPIRAAVDGNVRYYLLFATRHPKGVSVMNDILYGTEERYRADFETQHSEPSAKQMSLFDNVPENYELEDSRGQVSSGDEFISAELLKGAVVEALRCTPQCRASYLELRCVLAEQYFARVKRASYSQPLRELHKANKIRWASSSTKLPTDDDIIYLL